MFCLRQTGFLIILGFLNACSVLEPAPPAASFIHIDSISLSTDPQSEGSNASRITDAWVIYNEKYLGTFPLPADFPVLGEGMHRIQVKAGVIENGISSIRSAYPKYVLYDTIVNLEANKKVNLYPRVRYNNSAHFVQIEDFDDASLSLESTNLTYAPLAVTQNGDPDAFEGNSGTITIDQSTPVFEIASSTAFTLPLDIPTYLELNYKCEQDFKIGMYISTNVGVVKSELLSVKATADWKKIYVSLSDLGGVQTTAIEYKLYLGAEKGANVFSARYLFDNLKIVY